VTVDWLVAKIDGAKGEAELNSIQEKYSESAIKFGNFDDFSERIMAKRASLKVAAGQMNPADPAQVRASMNREELVEEIKDFYMPMGRTRRSDRGPCS